MGLSTQSSNLALPSSRLVLFLKRRSYGRMVQKSGQAPPEKIPAHHLEYSQVERGPIWLTARFLNRLAEAWYRQVVSMSYQLRGYVVVYDRHFLFDAAPMVTNSQIQKQPPLDHLYYQIISHFYPEPNLVILLNTPAKILYERKGEATPEYLNRQMEAYLKQGEKLDSFVQVDATKPIDQVLEEVTQHILDLYESQTHHRFHGNG